MVHDDLLERLRQSLLDGSITRDEVDRLIPPKPRGRPKKPKPPTPIRKPGGQFKEYQRLVFALVWPILSAIKGKQRAKEHLTEWLGYSDIRSVEKLRQWFERNESKLGFEVIAFHGSDDSTVWMYLNRRDAALCKRRMRRGVTNLYHILFGIDSATKLDLPMNPQKIE